MAISTNPTRSCNRIVLARCVTFWCPEDPKCHTPHPGNEVGRSPIAWRSERRSVQTRASDLVDLFAGTRFVLTRPRRRNVSASCAQPRSASARGRHPNRQDLRPWSLVASARPALPLLRRTGLYHPAVAAVFGAQNASPFTDRGADVRIYERNAPEVRGGCRWTEESTSVHHPRSAE